MELQVPLSHPSCIVKKDEILLLELIIFKVSNFSITLNSVELIRADFF